MSQRVKFLTPNYVEADARKKMSARHCIQRLTTWMCPQQGAFKNILRTYSGSSFMLSSELCISTNHVSKQWLLPATGQAEIVRRCHTLSHERMPLLVLDTNNLAHNSLSYSTDSKSTSAIKSGKEDTGGGQQQNSQRHRDAEREPLPEWPDGVNPHTGEKGGPKGPEPTRYGDWERKGRVSDF